MGTARRTLKSLPPERTDAIRAVVAERQFKVVFQPIYAIPSMELFGCEALVRPTSPLFPDPPTLLAAAVQGRVCGELGRGIRAMAIEACPHLPLFLNVHPNEFDEGFLVRPDDAIFRADKDIYLEITESVPLSHFRLCHSVLRELRHKGVSLVVDDFGSGYSNVRYIAELEPEVVKLDMEMVRGAARSPRLRKLLISVVSMCVDQGAKVVAEGIETEAELKVAIDAGVHLGQGYFLGRPSFPPPLMTPNGGIDMGGQSIIRRRSRRPPRP
jgi:EAL domain-containing protein (putative c-di-GMP-specific phosphodiesterase class I)